MPDSALMADACMTDSARQLSSLYRHDRGTRRVGAVSLLGKGVRMSNTIAVTAPMAIGARLLPAIRVAAQQWISLELLSRDEDGRLAYAIYIDCDSDEWQLREVDAIRSAVGASIDYRATMAAVISFLLHDAECYSIAMRNHEVDSDYAYNATIAEWAYFYQSELETIAMELESE